MNTGLTEVSSDGSSLESQYDAEYLRAGTTENVEKKGFLYYNGELLAEHDAEGNNVSRYILGYGVAAGWNERYHFYHLDGRTAPCISPDRQEMSQTAISMTHLVLSESSRRDYPTGYSIPDNSMTRPVNSIICGRDIIIRQWEDSCRRMCTVGMD